MKRVSLYEDEAWLRPSLKRELLECMAQLATEVPPCSTIDEFAEEVIQRLRKVADVREVV